MRERQQSGHLQYMCGHASSTRRGSTPSTRDLMRKIHDDVIRINASYATGELEP